MKRIALAVIVALPALASASPALAQTATARIVGLGNGAVVSGTVNVRGEGSAATGVERVVLTINGAVVGTRQPSGVQNEAGVDYAWNTNRVIGSSAIAPNGTYTITVDVTANGGGSDRASVSVRVNNAPVAPSNLSTSVNGQTFSMSWADNPEPDIVGYAVEQDDGGGFRHVATVQQSQFTETLSPGDYSFRVIALRSSPTGSPRASAPSTAVSATIKPPPTPTPGPGGSPGPGGGPGSRGGPGSGGGSNKGGGGVFNAGDRGFAVSGLPSLSGLLPGGAGLPDPPSTPFRWGSYKKRLPYEFPRGAAQEVALPTNVAARAPARIIPPDGLRWVAAGLLALAAAGLLLFVSRRVLRPAGQP